MSLLAGFSYCLSLFIPEMKCISMNGHFIKYQLIQVFFYSHKKQVCTFHQSKYLYTFIFKKIMGSAPRKAEQRLLGMELQEKKKEEKRFRNKTFLLI